MYHLILVVAVFHSIRIISNSYQGYNLSVLNQIDATS